MAIDIDMAAMALFARDVLEANQRPGGKNSGKGMATATESIPIISGSCVNMRKPCGGFYNHGVSQ